MWLNKLFLVKVYKHNKVLFAFFSGFICLSFYFNYKGVETTPFFIWAMYSGKMAPQQQYNIITVAYNDTSILNLPHTYQEPQGMMVYFTLNHFGKTVANDMRDPMENVLATVLPHYPFLKPVAGRLVNQPQENARYTQWLKAYLGSILQEPVNNITVYQRTIHFNTTGRVVEDSSKILYLIQ